MQLLVAKSHALYVSLRRPRKDSEAVRGKQPDNSSPGFVVTSRLKALTASQICPETVHTHFTQGFPGKQAAAAQYASCRAAQVAGVLVATVGHKGPVVEDGVDAGDA